MEITHIDFVFNTREIIGVDRQYIGFFYTSELKTRLLRSASNSICKYVQVEDFAIEIKRNFDTENMQILSRYEKIKAIKVTYENDTTEYIHVAWDEANDNSNLFQKQIFNKFGDLYIVISKDNKLDEFFKEDEINDLGIVHFSWAMYE